MKKPTELSKSASKRPRVEETSLRRDGKDGRAVRPISKAASGGATVAAPQAAQGQMQYKWFEEAARLFHARKFKEARDVFQKALTGPNREIAHKSELHVRMCNRRLESADPQLKTLDDHYNYAIAQINVRGLETAERHLRAALELDARADHVYYALALCRGLSGDLKGAYENLKLAIDLQPRNRIAARQDVDFAAISNQPPLDRLLYPEKAPPA
jgi:tetratricopeptide (TPR) repeat protein